MCCGCCLLATKACMDTDRPSEFVVEFDQQARMSQSSPLRNNFGRNYSAHAHLLCTRQLYRANSQNKIVDLEGNIEPRSRQIRVVRPLIAWAIASMHCDVANSFIIRLQLLWFYREFSQFCSLNIFGPFSP